MNIRSKQAGWLSIPAIALLLSTPPALAHHAMGNQLPSNFLEGFLSGIAHPLIGIDHFAFIVAVGVLAAARPRGIALPIAFIVTAMLGTGAHVAQLAIPGVELLVSGSIVLFGVLLILKDKVNGLAMTGLAAIAGLFHGYAYGEAIFGAEMTPLWSYLLGFTMIQLMVSLSAFVISNTILRRSPGSSPFRSVGLVILGIGLAFFGSQLVDLLFPAPIA
jgi:urease accessory protein